ncbi:CG13492 [Drosophila busckii]|uniref:CG13492 n=1 Tax=Drosophila busckii TaxID=30019 RepID=A0A0M4E4H3_DROBS|nr:uncharacterized protein LOC108595004 [Drosophila busckii]ALC40954.1 CG13492 [Drosophila busckii]
MRVTTAGVALLLLVLHANNPSDAWGHNWHTGPINCYTCSGAEECGEGSGLLRKCDGSVAQSCMAVFDTKGAVIERGCSDALAETCAEKDASCYECRSHGCNNLKTNKQLISCLDCDAQDDGNCVFDHELITERRQCQEQCITALYARESDADSALELVRTCLDDLDYDDRAACAAGELTNCVACNKANCNTHELGVRGTCNFCSEGKCEKPQPVTCRAVPANEQPDHCFIQLNEAGEISAQGCLSQYNVSDIKVLQGEKRLWTCQGENCNVESALPKPHPCLLCSSHTAEPCAVDPTIVETASVCNHKLITDCYSLLRDDGHTERGCMSSLDAEDYLECLDGSNATRCTTCAGDNCNNKLQPAERLSCHICESNMNENCESGPEHSTLCPLHMAGQGCTTMIDDEGHTLRGCSGSLSCSGNACSQCAGNNCNSHNLKRRVDGNPGQWGQKLPMSCRICSDVASCADSSNVDQLHCSTKGEYCMTVFDEAGKLATLGCSNSVESAWGSYCDAHPESCHNCNSNNCNTEDTKPADYNSCIFCDSNSNPNCAKNPTAVTNRRQCNGQCMSALRPIGSGSFDFVRGCLDDKEPEDQIICAAGSDAKCAACSGDDCNVHDLATGSLSCYVCSDTEDCEIANVAVCSRFSENDQCYTLYDDTASVAGMGCVSDLDDDFIEANLENLVKCSDNICNSFENRPTPNDCAVCSSLDDENCAVDPSKIKEFENCDVLPNTGCMTRVHSDNSTRRGCLSSLSKTLLRACLKGEGNCEVCEGDLCNKEIYPADRRRCQRCNSKDDPTCGSSPNHASVCPRYNQDQGCSVKLVNDATYRGCQTEFTCDESDKQYCRHCANGDNCNVVDLSIWNIGYPGNWVQPPINCYHCEGLACRGESSGLLQKCANNNNQNCATVFASNGSVVMRGCTDLLYGDAELLQYCDGAPNNCKQCKSTGCNNAKQLSSYVDCLICEGASQWDCVGKVDAITKRVSCQGSCFTGLYARNRSETDSAFELARGCLDDLEYDDRQACTEGSKQHCVACNGAACNKAAVPEKRLSCNYCDDEKCDKISPKTCSAYRENDECYIHVGDLRIESMGCASDLSRSFMQTNYRDLSLCSGDNCNTKAVIKEPVICHICNSTWDSGCVSGNSILTVECQHYLTPECYTKITDDGIIKRGCVMDIKDDYYDDCISGSSSSCQVCNTQRCNSELYPADWQRCIRCDSKKDKDCEKNPTELASYCPVYHETDGCLTSFEKGRTRRGCQSELYCDEDQTGNCRKCDSENCNTVDLSAGYAGEPGNWQDLPLTCLVCDDAKSCVKPTTSSSCSGNIKQNCATVFDAEGQVIQRGCSDEVLAKQQSYCEANQAKCPQCKSNKCNDAESLANYVECYQCDADLDPSCAFELPSKTRQCQGGCISAMYPRSSAADSALLPTRGCFDDLELSDRELCAAGKLAHCTQCSKDLCNSEPVIKEPQSCYTCSSADCMDMEATKCVAYKEQHQCYLAFDQLDVVAMGCASDMETQVINELVAQQRLLICDGQNCNNPNIIPEPNNCLQCSSSNETRCATNPNQLLEMNDICSQLPYTQCVTHVNPVNGVTTRGCLASLPAEQFYDCLTGKDSLCEICTGSNCNGLSVFPANRRRCHQCDSASNGDCAAAPNSAAVCAVYDEQQQCLTSLRDELTERGCSSSLSCLDASDASTCRHCDGDNCNTVDLERLHVHGKPGTWQEVPISCLSCADEKSCAKGGGSAVSCTGSDNCITVFSASGVVTQRGCSAAVSSCEANPELCPRCNSNGCNSADSLDDYVECLVCDSSKQSDCVSKPAALTRTRLCHKRCMSAFRPLYAEDNEPTYALMRNCYDDMEAADRESCVNSAKPYCATCDKNKCNTEDLVPSRLSCLSCQGVGCVEAKPATCANYRADDQCFIQLDEQQSVVAQGCLSEFSHADIYLLRKEKRLLSCETKDCNTLALLPASQTCALCSSRTDAKCAVNPSGITSETQCQHQGFSQCYTRVLDDGATERGCLSSLEQDEFLGCYNGTAKSCDSCSGDRCNMKKYPEQRTSCHICNSASDISCEATPNSLAICPVYAEQESCVTNLRGGVTYRGCGSSLSCEPNAKNCVYCTGEGCNVADLSQHDDDNYGKWQDLPLSCLSCDGADCQKTELSSARCTDNNEQDCVTVFDDKGAVVHRGCEDVVAAHAQLGGYCASNAASCPHCKSNNCNNATKTTDYNSCIYCDSYKSSACLDAESSSAGLRRRQCQGSCMSALYGSSELGLDVIRTCLDDKEPADQLKCKDGKDANCFACSGADCNVHSLPTDRLSCFVCEGDACELPTTSSCPIYKPNDRCFMWLDEQNNIQQLGCLSSFRNQDLESVIKTKRIAVCEGANCNSPMQLPTPVKCAVCDSRVDPNCATSPVAIGNITTCDQMPHTNCVTKLQSDGSTTRGCLYDLDQDEFAACLLGMDENCEVCGEDGCNREIYPADRMQCYSCSSLDDSKCESDPSRKSVCAWVSEWETCQTQLVISANGNETRRGCSSVLSCDKGDYKNCRHCVGTGCNSIDLANRVDDGQHGFFQPLPLKCHTCEGEHCHSSLGPAMECTLNSQQDCKTVFELDGKTVRRRGCADDVDDYEDRYCRQNPKLCFNCKSNECNDAWDSTEYNTCTYCNSDSDAKCVTSPVSKDIAERQCQGKCLVAVVNKKLVRSCLDDKEIFDRSDCSSDASGKNCAVCDSEHCNIFDYPADRLSCHVCRDSECSSSHAEVCLNYDEKDFCFAKYTAGAVQLMGCASSQKDSDLAEWRKSNLLHECSGKDCNDMNRLPKSEVCVSCDSSKNPACAQNPAAVTDTVNCNAPQSGDCLTRVDASGNTLRGCRSSLEADDCVAKGTCAACAGRQCNVEIFPANRRKCQICDGATEGWCANQPNNLAVCPVYAADDSCVSMLDLDNKHKRGCHSQLKCINEDERYCQVCTTDGCNTLWLKGGAAALGGIGLTLTLLASLLASIWRQ